MAGLADMNADEQRGAEAERAQAIAYFSKFEASSRDMAAKAETDESRIYQTTIANAMKAMVDALGGGYHWK